MHRSYPRGPIFDMMLTRNKKSKMMRRLYHMLFCPFSRKIAMGVREKELGLEEILERPLKLSADLLKMNLTGSMPFLIDQALICNHHYAACEYLDEMYAHKILMGESPLRRAHVRRLMIWFEEDFYQEVFLSVFYEKIGKIHKERLPPDAVRIKKGLAAIPGYMKILNALAEKDHFLAGRDFSWADITAIAHLSCLDYLGHIPWRQFPAAHEWSMKIKSRPSFRPFLSETLPNIQPAPHYPLLDF